jgi:hypothetical protein
LDGIAGSHPVPVAGRILLASRASFYHAATPSRFIDLKTLHDVRVEMARVYREMRASRIETQDGTRLVYVLSQIGRIVEIQQVDSRLEAVERVLRLRGNP